MANPEASDGGVDPLHTQFADLSMSAPPAGGTAPVDPESSSFWTAQDTSLSYQSPTDFSIVHQSQPLTDPALDPQFGGYPQYADLNTGAQQGYWQDPSTPDLQAVAHPAQAGSSSASSVVDKPFKCDHSGCDQAYRLQCELTKHKNNHERPRSCPICPKGKAERKDLNRHMWTNHPDEARARNIPKEEDRCPVCGYTGRKDNVKRHRDMKDHW